MHPYYNVSNFPHFVVNHGNWDIYRNDADNCAAIPADPDSGCHATHFGNMAYVRQTLAAELAEQGYSVNGGPRCATIQEARAASLAQKA